MANANELMTNIHPPSPTPLKLVSLNKQLGRQNPILTTKRQKQNMESLVQLENAISNSDIQISESKESINWDETGRWGVGK